MRDFLIGFLQGIAFGSLGHSGLLVVPQSRQGQVSTTINITNIYETVVLVNAAPSDEKIRDVSPNKLEDIVLEPVRNRSE
jgi:hypothetical protein